MQVVFKIQLLLVVAFLDYAAVMVNGNMSHLAFVKRDILLEAKDVKVCDFIYYLLLPRFFTIYLFALRMKGKDFGAFC